MSGNPEVRNVVESAVESAVAKLRSELVDAISSGLPEAPAAAPAPAPAGGGGGLAPFRAELFEVLSGNGQVELLNKLMGALGRHWSRSVLFLVKGEDFQPWAAQGFEGGVGNDAAKTVAVPGSKDTLLSVALNGSGSGADNSILTEGLGAPSGPSAAVPIGIRGKAAAVLYADGPKDTKEEAVAALELLARLTAAQIELGMLTKRSDPGVRTDAAVAELGSAAAAAPAAPAAEPEPASDLSFEVPPAAPAAEPEPEPAPASSWSAEPEPAAPAPEPEPEPAAPEPAAAEPPAAPQPAAPAAEVGAELAAAKGSAVVDAGQNIEPAKKYSRWKPVRQQIEEGEPEDESLKAFPEEERPLHVEAKKLARILVAEIKLYNEAKVAVGKKNKDLYERLKEDIDRSRATYDDRVKPVVADKVDYFKEELVQSLADGDASALGM